MSKNKNKKRAKFEFPFSSSIQRWCKKNKIRIELPPHSRMTLFDYYIFLFGEPHYIKFGETIYDPITGKSEVKMDFYWNITLEEFKNKLQIK